jgi:hypothetical protein
MKIIMPGIEMEIQPTIRERDYWTIARGITFVKKVHDDSFTTKSLLFYPFKDGEFLQEETESFNQKNKARIFISRVGVPEMMTQILACREFIKPEYLEIFDTEAREFLTLGGWKQ